MRDAILRPVGLDGQVYRAGAEEAFAKAVKASKSPPDLAALARDGVIAGFGTGKAGTASSASEAMVETAPAAAPAAPKKKGKRKG